MRPLSKLVLLYVLFFLPINPLIGRSEEIFDIGVADETSASWQFTRHLSTAWKTTYQSKEERFVPRYTKTIQERLELLRTRQIRFAIAPLNFLTIESSRKTYIKVTSLLWKVFLAPIVSTETKEKVDLTTYQRWFVPRDSVIIPSAFPYELSAYEDWLADQQARDAKNNADAGHESLLEGAETIGGKNSTQGQDLETQLLKMRRIILIDPQILVDDPTIFYNDILFYEITGSFKNLLALFGDHLAIQSLHPQLIEKMRRRVDWLETMTYHVGKQQNIETLGMTMALFTHNAEDPELIRNIIKILNKKPYKFFPNPYLFENLRSGATKYIPQTMLHDASIRYYLNQ